MVLLREAFVLIARGGHPLAVSLGSIRPRT
jgi:hypothetical protein